MLLAPVPSDQRPPAEVITNLIEEGKAQFIPYSEQQALLWLLYSYRTLTEAEIEKYIAFAQSEPGQKYNSVVIQGMYDAMLKSAQSMWRRFTQQ